MTAGHSIGTQPYAALAVDIYAEKLNAGKPLSILFRPAAELRGFGDLWHLRRLAVKDLPNVALGSKLPGHRGSPPRPNLRVNRS